MDAVPALFSSRRNNICEIWRLRKAHTQRIHVWRELSRNWDVATQETSYSTFLKLSWWKYLQLGLTPACNHPPSLCPAAPVGPEPLPTFQPAPISTRFQFQPDSRPKLRLQSGAYVAHKVCHLLLRFLPLNSPQSRFSFLLFFSFLHFCFLNHFLSFSCFIFLRHIHTTKF